MMYSVDGVVIFFVNRLVGKEILGVNRPIVVGNEAIVEFLCEAIK